MATGRLARFCFSPLLMVGVFSAAPVFAQETQEIAIETSKYQIEGLVNGNAVFVRSGGSENDYAVMQLNKGAAVTVVGERFNWLKITPPEGSFCYVAKAYVNRAGDGSIGQSTGTPYVRVGSSLNQLKTKVAGKLEPNQRVEIIGEQDEYFKIKPPADVFFYVNKQFVDPVRQIPAPGPEQKPEGGQLAQGSTGGGGPTTKPQNPVTPSGDAADPRGDEPAGAGIAGAGTGSGIPATQPTVDAEAEFDRLEKLYSQASLKPLDQQPVAELLTGYKQLASNTTLPESLRRICEQKTSILEGRDKVLKEYVEIKAAQDTMKAKQQALQQERQEIETRISGASVKFYTAIGTLRTSSMQFGPVALFRLTDPSNGRTVCYIRSDDAKLGQRIGEFIGIKGEVTIDAQRSMTIITPASFEPIDAGKVGQGIMATYTPPSLLPGGVASGADNGQ